MARVLPDPLVGSFPPEFLRIWRALKGIPGDEFMVWAGLPLQDTTQRPDFLVVHSESTAFVIAVSGLTDRMVEEHVHGSLFATLPTTNCGSLALGADERGRIKKFIELAQMPDDRESESTNPGPPAVYGIVVFPNASHERLREAWRDNPVDGCYWLGGEYASSEQLGKNLRRLAKGGLKERQLACLRSHFSPETVVPRRFSARGIIKRNVDAEFGPMLLDYEQEAWAKNRLRLSDEATAVAEAPAPHGEATLVTGVAGSGKSLVLLFRACTQAQLDPQSRALVLTHNKALRRELETRFGELGHPSNIEWNTFFSWVDAGMSGSDRDFTIVQYKERNKLIADAVRAEGETASEQWVGFLADEFDWMQDRATTSRDEYLKVERIGRGVGLTHSQRERVHAIYERYCASLTAIGAEDWSGRALRFWRGLTADKIAPRLYDYIYIDEAQFFAPVWLRTLQRALRPGTGRLLLAADPTQGFLKRRQSWVACGLDLRGRSTRLRKSYRNTRPILEFAASFYRSRLKAEDEGDLNLPDEMELSSAEPGEAPLVVSLTSRQDEVTRVSNEVNDFLLRGGDPEAILVLVGTGTRSNEVLAHLNQRFGAERVADARQTSGRGKLRVCSVDAATGLEAPVVFLIGGAELLERENDLQMSVDQREELRRDNTRRLYMAFTRAGLKLVVTWVGNLPVEWSSRLSKNPSSSTRAIAVGRVDKSV